MADEGHYIWGVLVAVAPDVVAIARTIQGIGSLPTASSTASAVTIWCRQTKLSRHIAAHDAAVALPGDPLVGDLAADALKGDLYISPGLRPLGLSKTEAGKQDELVGIVGFAVDIDAPGALRAAANLPSTESDVRKILEAIPHPPTLLVKSGTGESRHAWWFFTETMPIATQADVQRLKRASKKFHAPMHGVAKQNGWHLDDTSKLNQWLRLPGSLNHKYDTPIQVVVEDVSRDYEFDELSPDGRKAIIQVPRTAPPAAAPVMGSTGAAPASMGKSVAPRDVVIDRIKRVRPDHPRRILLDRLLAGADLFNKHVDDAEAMDVFGRDDAMLKTVMTVLYHLPRSLDPADVRQTLHELFEPVFAIWVTLSENPTTIEREHGKLDVKLDDTFARRARHDDKRARDEAAVAEAYGVTAIDAPPPTSAAAPPVEIQPPPAAQSPVLDQNEAILQWGKQFYVYTWGRCANPDDVGYRGPFIKDELIPQLRALWEMAPRNFRLMHFVTKYEGTKREKIVEEQKPIAMLLAEYGAACAGVQGSVSLQQSYFDPETRTLHLALCPLRITEGVFDPQIDEFLRLQAGPQQEDKYLDWIASVARIGEQTCGLYFEGPMSIGKNVVANGLSRLWRKGGPTDFASVMDTFNGSLFEQPFCQLDEGLPGGAKQTSALIRKMIGRSEHAANEKNQRVVKVEGTVRLMITANNDHVLLQLAQEDYSEADLEAFVNRILHIKGQQAAADYIAGLNQIDRSIVDSWIYDDKIAKHAYWLADNRPIKPGKRFLVEGETTEMHRALVTRGDKRGIVLEWIASYINDPHRLDQNIATNLKPNEMPRILMGDGKLYVNTTALKTWWTHYGATEHSRPTSTAIGRVLSAVSHGRRKLGSRKSDRPEYHDINVDHILSWAIGAVQVGSEDTMRANLARPLNMPTDPNDGEDEDQTPMLRAVP